MEPVILFRPDFNDDTATSGEINIAREYLPVVTSRVELKDKLVIGRYSVLPFYRELDDDLNIQNSRLINSYFEHDYIASFSWYEDVVDMTPRTWFRLQDVPKDGGPYIVKGRTNSRKFEWDKLMFAPTFKRACEIEGELMQDGLIGPQGGVIREYVPLKTLEVGLHGLPFANEWRFFFYGTQRLCNGFYWTAAEARGVMDNAGLDFANRVAARISKRASFFVIDIAEKSAGGWTLIEVNDAQMSGLSECDPRDLYMNLARVIA